MEEPSWDIGDGYLRWCRGISLPKYLIALIRPEVMAYVSGCHLKFVQLSLPNCEVLRMFHPGLEGIDLLEGKPTQGIFALAERARNPRIHIYRFENDKDVLISELKGAAENRFRAIRFNEDDFLLVLSGVPELCISIWRWATGEQIMVVECLESGYESDLLISPINGDLWVEWSQNYVTYYELTTFGNDKTVIRTEVALPRNECSLDEPDPRFGDPFSIDIVSVTFDFGGTIFVLDHVNEIHKINPDEKVLVPLGSIDLSHEAEGVVIEYLVPYGKCIAALLSSGVFLILLIKDDQIKVKGRLDFTSRIRKFIKNPCAPHPNMSFYAITDVEKRVECVLDGKMRAHYVILDLTLSEIQSICFIERNARYLGAVSEKGGVYILDVDTGNIFTRWKLAFYAESIASHPLLPMVAIGTADGCVIYLDIRDLKNPQIIHRSFLCEDTEIDKLAWTCRGRYMIAGDSQRRHLFLTYGLPSMEFHYLDYSSLPGSIRAINTPASAKDKRLQVVLQETEGDEVPFQVNNYRLDGESLELVASQLLDAPIKTLCFSSFKKLMYGYTCGNHCVGMLFFTEDMHAGGLLEPDIQFEGDLPLHVNRMLLVGDRLYTFGEDGYAMQHIPPAPKETALHTEEVLQTHFPSYDGIKDGILSMNGCHLLTIGYDNTIVHVQLKPESEMLSWGLLGYGLDMDRVIDVQMKYLNAINIQKEVEIGDTEIDLYIQSVNDERLYQTRRNEVLLKSVKDGLAAIRNKVQELIQLNSTRDPAEQLRLEEFELDDDVEEIEAKECEKDKQIAEIIITTLVEERDKWANRMKTLMWDDFEIKICKINGFNVNQEVANYPLRPGVEDNLKKLEILRHERRIEKKLLAVDSELHRARKEAIAKVVRIVKKRRVKKRNIDLSKYPPHLRDEMRKLLREMPLESDSDDIDDLGAIEGVFRKMTATALPQVDETTEQEEEESNEADEADGEAEEDEEIEDEEEEIEEDEDEEEGIIEFEIPEEAEEEEEELEAIVDEELEEEEALGEHEEEEEIDGEGLEVDILDPFYSPPGSVKSMASPPGSRGGSEEEEEEEEAESSSEESEDDEDYEEDPIPLDLDLLAPEIYPVRRKKPKKKRRMAFRKANDDDDDDTHIWIEVDDSSDQSDSDMERQIGREEERQKRLIQRLNPEDAERKKLLQLLYSGSLTYEFFEPNSLLFDQLDLAALHEMHAQIQALTSEIRKLKTNFNEAFEDLKAVKKVEIEGIVARNTRIRKIAEFFDINVKVKDPELTVFEQPETIFEVKESEITVEKVLSDEEKAKILAEEAARLEEKALETSRKKVSKMEPMPPTRPEDILKIDIPKPHFMIAKEEWKWSAEEMEKAADYYKKVEILEKARAENRKELELELRGLLKANAEAKNQFDARLKKLQESRMMHELCIRMEEVKISRLVRHIMKRFEIEAEEDRLNNLLKKLQTAIKTTHRLASDLASRVDNCTIQYNAITEKEKLLERTFRMDLGEVGYFYDTFAKMYKKRPKVNFKADKTGDLMRIVIRAMAAQTLRLNRNDSEGQHAIEAIYDLDDPMQTPVGCPRSTWDRFCRLRHEKIICEYEAKLISDELTILHKILNTFKGREGESQQSIAAVLSDISRQRDLRLGHTHNVEFQMVVHNGQIELPQALVRRDFFNALLIQKHLVEACNVKIRKYESLKLAGLERAKVQHRSVKQIEWKFKQVQLEEKHAQEKLRDINTLRITKEVVKFLQSYDDFKIEEQRRLEAVRKLQDGFKKFHDKVMSHKGSVWRRLKSNAESTVQDTEQKEELVLERNLNVCARRMLCNVNDRNEIIQNHRERMLIIMRSAYFVRRIAKNADEILCLETELDRLYKKTFPLL